MQTTLFTDSCNTNCHMTALAQVICKPTSRDQASHKQAYVICHFDTSANKNIISKECAEVACNRLRRHAPRVGKYLNCQGEQEDTEEIMITITFEGVHFDVFAWVVHIDHCNADIVLCERWLQRHHASTKFSEGMTQLEYTDEDHNIRQVRVAHLESRDFDYKRELHYNSVANELMHKAHGNTCTLPGTELLPVAFDPNINKFYCRMKDCAAQDVSLDQVKDHWYEEPTHRPEELYRISNNETRHMQDKRIRERLLWLAATIDRTDRIIKIMIRHSDNCNPTYGITPSEHQ